MPRSPAGTKYSQIDDGFRPSTERYIFTVTAGRSGQASLTRLLTAHVADCYAAFEEPRAKVRLRGYPGDLERRFRRRFIETHELLGRGRVLAAYQSGDAAYLDRIVARRLKMIERLDVSIYVDVSKYFARGLHDAFARAVGDFGLIRLVRDPVLNMRSFLNRNKSFRLDNSAPDAPNNEICLDPDGFEPGEFYLWAWSEMYLRFERLVETYKVRRAVEIRTDELNDATRMAHHFGALGLDHTPLTVMPPENTNRMQGHGETLVTQADIQTFKRFMNRLPSTAIDRIGYLRGYDPPGVECAEPHVIGSYGEQQ